MKEKIIEGLFLAVVTGCKVAYDIYKKRKQENRIAKRVEERVKEELKDRGIILDEEKES